MSKNSQVILLIAAIVVLLIWVNSSSRSQHDGAPQGTGCQYVGPNEYGDGC